MLKILQKILKYYSIRIIKKYSPVIIGVTGSVGKTSTKEAIFAVLHKKHPDTRRNIKNYNNEIGLPLTIIGTDTGGKSLMAWLKIFAKARALLKKTDPTYPTILILEMGADKPGDIEYLTKIAPCQIGILTKIGTAHIEFFGSIEKIAEEKRHIITHLDKSGFAILNADDELVVKFQKQTKAQVITFGVSSNATVAAIEINTQREKNAGTMFKLKYKGASVPAFLPNTIGRHQIYPALAAAAVGLALGMNLVEISEGLRGYKSPKGRMNLIKGINGSLIIDDTYNSSPEAATAAIETLAETTINDAGRKIAVLGDMLELGERTNISHFEIGKLCAKKKIDLLICSGKFGKIVESGAVEHGLNNNQVFAVDNADEAGQLLTNMLKQDDIILIKGSQGSRMEKTVKAIMAEPEKAGELLIRQDSNWKT
jgi:UDP-N-acetylmuramoyl-tripeptide--D-alanyl-D-alanine ligase